MRKHPIYYTRALGLQSSCTALAMKLPFLLRERLRDSVQYNCQDHDTQSRLESFRDIVLLNTLIHDASESASAHHRGDYHHGQGQQDHLIHPGEDSGHGQWQLYLVEDLFLSGPES